jgi:hypothetical protein
MGLNNLSKWLTCILWLVFSQPASAVWFEATGQAAIIQNNKQAARQEATQDAIRQALLFAGASVKSVQKMANGLLQDDRFEVRAAGEVGSIELIDEIYHEGYITVSIRADIFPQEISCSAGDYKKNIVTTWYEINKRPQAAVGNMYDFGKVLASRLQTESKDYAQYSTIKRVEPYYLSPSTSEGQSLAFTLAKKTDTQYVLFGEILEFAVETQAHNRFAFWKADDVQRNLSLSMALYDGSSGELLFKEQQSIRAPWQFDLYKPINSQGHALWESAFGKATQSMLQDLSQKIDQEVSCLPSYGRVISISNEQLSINIGKQNGVKVRDELILFQVSQFYDSNNQLHKQFQLHPEKVVVTQVFAETAVVESLNGAPLANIQANDFVARR